MAEVVFWAVCNDEGNPYFDATYRVIGSVSKRAAQEQALNLLHAEKVRLAFSRSIGKPDASYPALLTVLPLTSMADEEFVEKRARIMSEIDEVKWQPNEVLNG